MKSERFYSIIYLIVFLLFTSTDYSQDFQNNHQYLSKTPLGVLLRGEDGIVYIRHQASARERIKWEKASSPDEFLKDNPENFEIPYLEISALELDNGVLLVFGEDLDAPEHKFRIARNPSTAKKQARKFAEFISNILPEKV